ncbi:hypothetical protein ACSSS7_007960 [Eimeria intestinalis]
MMATSTNRVIKHPQHIFQAAAAASELRRVFSKTLQRCSDRGQVTPRPAASALEEVASIGGLDLSLSSNAASARSPTQQIRGGPGAPAPEPYRGPARPPHPTRPPSSLILKKMFSSVNHIRQREGQLGRSFGGPTPPPRPPTGGHQTADRGGGPPQSQVTGCLSGRWEGTAGDRAAAGEA